MSSPSQVDLAPARLRPEIAESPPGVEIGLMMLATDGATGVPLEYLLDRSGKRRQGNRP